MVSILIVVGIVVMILLGTKCNCSIISYHGEIKRTKFIYLIIVGYLLLESIIFPQLFQAGRNGNIILECVYYIGCVTFISILLSAMMKRLHSLGYTGVWAVVFYGMKVVLVRVFPIVDYIFLIFLFLLSILPERNATKI